MKLCRRAAAGALAMGLGALLMLPGCDRASDRPALPSSGSGSPAQSASGSGQTVDDTAITAAVKAGILTEPALKVLQISVDTANGVVRLSGTVDSAFSVQKAAEVAGAVKGVKAVDNRLVVNSKSQAPDPKG